MELQHFSHEHPLVFIEDWSHESEKTYCSGCAELVSGPSYGCAKCGFYLDKQCAEAPSEISHPFHRNHSFELLNRHPYSDECPCDFCNQTCDNFVYHCSCKLDLHIKCALFSYNIAEKKIGDFQHISRIDPLISTENHTEELKKAGCFACWKPLLDSVYFSPDCGFYLHSKCADLPAEINHLLHHQHPLVLQFNCERLSCKICKKTQLCGFVYCCLPCDFVLHIECASIPTTIKKLYHRNHPLLLQFINDPLDCQICQKPTQRNEVVYFCSTCKFVLHNECVSPPPIIEDKIHHDHPFTLFQKQVSLSCDACGTFGNYVPYLCSTCNIVVHKKCISLPRIIKFYRHHHPIVHTYFVDGFEMWECRLCHEKVNTEHGSYFCSKCNYIVHVNCVLEKGHYYVVDSTETDEARDSASSTDEPDSNENATATSIRHFSHDHILELKEDIKADKQCDGCLLFISASYYCCSQCDFFLHKACSKLPKRKHFWYHYCQKLLRLTSSRIFRCNVCDYLTSGFGYYCDECEDHRCLRCALVPDIPRCEGHEHLLPYYWNYEGLCDGCGVSITYAFRCKSCNFNLEDRCLNLPLVARHKNDEHLFKLTYHDNNNYPESHLCDICENERNPNHWFYHCAVCNNSAHPKCVLGEYSFIKVGSTYTYEGHPHPLTFVQKVLLYPECRKCGKPCLDLALECKDGCSYIVHWKCIKPRGL